MAKTQTKAELKNNSSRHTVKILGVAIDSTETSGVLIQVQESIVKKQKLFITTPNPEIVLAASRDANLMEALNDSDIAVPDGTGVVMAARLQGQVLIPIKGRQLFNDLLKRADEKKWKVGFIGNKEGSADAALKVLQKRYRNAIMYSFVGPNLDLDGNPETSADIVLEKSAVSAINQRQFDILFVGFGSPRQEKWVYNWKEKLSSSVVMVVGGTFDYISGKVSLPPSFWPDRLEWLWRLLTKPGHLKRVWKAVFTFPYQVLTVHFKNSK